MPRGQFLLCLSLVLGPAGPRIVITHTNTQLTAIALMCALKVSYRMVIVSRVYQMLIIHTPHGIVWHSIPQTCLLKVIIIFVRVGSETGIQSIEIDDKCIQYLAALSNKASLMQDPNSNISTVKD